MRKRQVFGWFILILGALILTFNILYDNHVYLGPFQFIYHIADWFSIGALFELIFESFGSVFEFIFDYFWCIFLIFVGIVFIFGAKKQREYEETQDYTTYESSYNQHSEDYSDTNLSQPKGKLCRNLDDMKLAGVCSGIAHILNIDPTLIRILVVFMGLSSGGFVLFVYIIMAIILPGDHLGHR